MVHNEPGIDKGFTIIQGGYLVDIERTIIEALSQLVSRAAAFNLLQRARASMGLKGQVLTPAAWIELIEGPLQQELGKALPMNGLYGPLGTLVKQIKSQAEQIKDPTITIQEVIPFEYIRLDSPEARRDLVLELAKVEDVIGVVLDTSYGRESRMPGYEESSLSILKVAHRLLSLRGGYRVFYTVLREAQLVLRPLGGDWLAVLARNEANLGQLLYRLSRIEADQVEAKP